MLNEYQLLELSERAKKMQPLTHIANCLGIDFESFKKELKNKQSDIYKFFIRGFDATVNNENISLLNAESDLTLDEKKEVLKQIKHYNVFLNNILNE